MSSREPFNFILVFYIHAPREPFDFILVFYIHAPREPFDFILVFYIHAPCRRTKVCSDFPAPYLGTIENSVLVLLN